MRLAFDIETDGFLEEVTKVHCINAADLDTGAAYRFHDDETVQPRSGSLHDGLLLLGEADELCGQNIIGYDLPVLHKVYPAWSYRGRVFDTKVAARLIWTNIRDVDFEQHRKGRLPEDFTRLGLMGSHSLRAWGVRMGFPKDDFDPKDYGHTWATIPFSQTMSDYCARDVDVTVKLRELIDSKDYSQEAIELEHQVEFIIQRQIRWGFCFDVEAAQRLTARLQVRRLELETELRGIFPPWQQTDGPPFIPKRDNKTRGYKAGVPVQKYKTVEFNPGSRDHIANRLIALHDWRPKEFTAEGKPKVDETILSSLPYPECPHLVEYLTVVKRLGQLAEGKEAWLSVVKADGRIHGGVNANGAVTGRMTHMQPNVAQTPSVGAPYGEDCRALFYPSLDLLVGCDAEGLELRMLGHFLARYDDGEFARSVVSGRKEDGTDAHSINKRIAGLNSRDSAKTLIYAFIYGAGDFKLGSIYVDDMTDAQRAKFNAAYPGGDARDAAMSRLGRKLRAKVLAGIPALKRLVEDVKKSAERGWLKGLDGRRLHVRSTHSALNTLLQSGGALVMKKALVLLDQMLAARGLVPGADYEFVANVHDEFQIDSKEEHAETIGKLAAQAINHAGRYFNLRVELSGSYAVGRNWKETH